MLTQDLRLAIRRSLASPGFAIAALTSMALAIGAAAAAFAVVDALRFRALPFRDADRLILIREPPARGGCPAVCDVTYDTYDKRVKGAQLDTLDGVAAYTSGAKVLKTDAGQVTVIGELISPSLFPMLGAAPLIGRTFTAEDDRVGAPLSVVLSHSLWTTYFGADPGIIGTVIQLSDGRYTVIGIMPAGFNHESGTDFWLAAVPALDPSNKPSIRSVTVIGHLAPGRTVAHARAELQALAASNPAPGVERRTLDAAPLRDRYVRSAQSHDLILAGVVAFVLLIALANLSNLMLVRTLDRQRDYAIRSALGSGVWRLARQVLTETTVLTLTGAGLGLLVARWALGVLRAADALQFIRPEGMDFQLDWRVIAFTTVVAFVAASLVALAPSRLVATGDVERVLRDTTAGASRGSGAARWQELFVILQVACALILLTGAGLLARTALRLQRSELGFDAAVVLQAFPSFPHAWRTRDKYLPLADRIVEELQTMPGVSRVAIQASVPLDGASNAGEPAIQLEGGRVAAGQVPGAVVSIGPDYFGVMGIRLLRGRTFTKDDREGAPAAAIVNESAARQWWPGEDAVGRRFTTDAAGAPITVVGIVADSKASRPGIALAETGPEIYRPWLQVPSPFPQFNVRAAGTPEALVRPLSTRLIDLVPNRPVNVVPVKQLVAGQMEQLRANALQVLAFAAVGVWLALTGVFGVIAYSVRRRTREIGIRGALGATRRDVIALVVSQGVRLTIVGCLVGLAGAAVVTRGLQSLLYGTSPIDPTVFALTPIAIVLVGALASFLPARAAAGVDPVTALRSN